MIAYFNRFVKYIEENSCDLVRVLEGNMTKYYLILANIVLVVFAIWFSNAGLLPFKNAGDFAFFAILALILGLYRPGWTFLFFIGTLALENVNLVPKEFGLALRPYQFFGFITIIALLVQAISKRLAFPLPKFRWQDSLLVIFAVAGFLSATGALNKGVSFKQSLIALSFVVLYFLTRVYVQSLEDAKRVLPFFLSSGFVIALYAVWQNLRFLAEKNSFEVMLGRPNGTFTEPDWLGIYLVFLLAMMLVVIFYQSRKVSILNYVLLVLIFVPLILTVARSAWLGAAFAMLVFLKFILLSRYVEYGDKTKGGWQKLWEILKIQNWQWKKTGVQLCCVLAALGISLLLVVALPLTKFQLANRAVSTGGLQKITIACPSNAVLETGKTIKNIDEIKPCRHINLEDINAEKAAGNVVLEISRPDPNVNIRAEIYQKAWQQIKENPILGIGWGNISQVLGTDERGAGLNASNIFLEVWLGAGLMGALALVLLLGYILVFSMGAFLSSTNEYRNGTAIAFVMLGWAAVVIPNLFNSGIFLGFVWVYLGVAVGLLAEKEA
jgi:hypothetical protein